MYVAVKGGAAAIENSCRLLEHQRRGDRALPALRVDQILQQLPLAVDRVMTEGALYDRALRGKPGSLWQSTEVRAYLALVLIGGSVAFGDSFASEARAGSPSRS